MDTAISIANLIVLIFIFFYQKYKNKVLKDQLDAQGGILIETKSLVSQQTVAIDGQHKVVVTALDYSERFNPQKLEDLVRREMKVDHSQEIEKLKGEFDKRLGETQAENQAALQLTFEKTVNLVATHSADLILSPLIQPIVNYLVNLEQKQREELVRSWPLPLSRPFEMVLDLIKKEEEKQVVSRNLQ